jgi:hypothetical protein
MDAAVSRSTRSNRTGLLPLSGRSVGYRRSANARSGRNSLLRISGAIGKITAPRSLSKALGQSCRKCPTSLSHCSTIWSRPLGSFSWGKLHQKSCSSFAVDRASAQWVRWSATTNSIVIE